MTFAARQASKQEEEEEEEEAKKKKALSFFGSFFVCVDTFATTGQHDVDVASRAAGTAPVVDGHSKSARWEENKMKRGRRGILLPNRVNATTKCACARVFVAWLAGGQLRIYLKNGQVRDADGGWNSDSDVYVRFYLGGSSTEQVVTSTLKEEDNTPTWNEWLTFSGNDIPAKVSLCVCVCLCICVCVCLCLLRDWFVLILPLFPLLLFSSQFSLFVEAYDSDTFGSEELVGCLSSAD